jgi:hypothetical protein
MKCYTHFGVLQKVAVLLLVQAAPSLELGDDDPRVHRVYSDLFGRQLQRGTPQSKSVHRYEVEGISKVAYLVERSLMARQSGILLKQIRLS